MKNAKIATAFLVFVLATGAQAQTPTLAVLHSFTGSSDGGAPHAGVIMDPAGNLYGTTVNGGTSGAGIVFRLDPSGNEMVLHSFTGSPGDGAFPGVGLIRDNVGNLYGTTIAGGTGPCTILGVSGCGIIFKLDTSGNETVLHSFGNSLGDGTEPQAGLIVDAAGNLYGTTRFGGTGTCTFFPTPGCGTVFKLDTSGNEKVLHSFTGPPGDGANPFGAALIIDKTGNFYGATTLGGASNAGTVFKLDTAGNETVLHSFTPSGNDGSLPEAALIIDAAGNLYGTTFAGGAINRGTIFKLDNFGNETVLYSFAGPPDGDSPGASLLMDKAGNLYGTTSLGGTGTCSFEGFGGCGTIFKLDTSGIETVLHSFTGADGNQPFASLVMDTAGNLYGTTFQGGASSQGTVFRLSVQAPTIATISPVSAVAGGPAFNLTVNGTNFVSGSTISFHGIDQATAFVSATQLTAIIPAPDIASAGTFSVTVTNPGGSKSNAVSFSVVTPQDATQTIINAVNVLFSQGVLNGGQDNSLVKQLQQAINLMNAGKKAGAIENLESFISEVNDLLNSGVLSLSQAASLISAAQGVIAALS